MNLITPIISKVYIKSENKNYIDFERENLPINLELVITFEKIGITTSGISFEIPCIKFIVANNKPILWYFEKEEQRDLLFKNIVKICKLKIIY